MPKFTITKATKADLESILAIDRVCLDGFWSENSYLSELENNNTDLFVLRSEGEVLGLGTMWLYFEEAHIIMLAVKPEYQSLGLGSALLWQMLFGAHNFGAEWVVLEVRVSNTRAIGLYNQFGFIEVGRRKAYYSNNQEDALVLWCKRVNTPEFALFLSSKQNDIRCKLFERGWQWLNSYSLPGVP